MSTQTIEKVDANIEQELNLVLVRNNLTEEKLAALNDRAMKHGGEIVSDAQYKEVLAVSQEIGKDVAIAKKNLKAMDRHRIDSNNAWRLMIQEVSAKVEEPLVLIGAPMAAYRAKKAKEEEERAAAVKQENDEREKKVIELGFVRHPGPPEHRYILEDMVVGITSIINVPHDVWTNTFNDMRMKSEEVISAKAEREAMDRLDAAMAEQRQREQDAREAELAQREADLKQKEEAANSALEQSRRNELIALGAIKEEFPMEPLFVYADGRWPEEVRMVKTLVDRRKKEEERETLVRERVKALKEVGWITQDDETMTLDTPKGMEMAGPLSLGQMDDSAFSSLVQKGQDELGRRREAEDRERVIKERVEQLKAVGWEEDAAGNLFLKTKEDWVYAEENIADWLVGLHELHLQRGRTELDRRQQEADKAARKKMEDEFAERQEAERLQAIEDEAKRVAALGDAEKWEEWVAIIKNSKPEMVGETSKRAVDGVISAVDGLNDFM